MKKILFIALLFIGFYSNAQKLKFQLVDATSKKPIASGHVISSFEHNFLTFSNDSGKFSLKIDHNDTLIITKDYYHSMYVNIKLSQFDTSHFLVLKMVPSEKQKNEIKKNNFTSLESFEYHFVHDTIGEDSHAKIHVFENVNAADKRIYYARPDHPDDLNMKIPLPEKAIHIKHHTDQSSYKLKED